MAAGSSSGHYDAHETARMHALEGVPLATFGQRALGFLIDLVLVVLLWIPLELLWARYVSHEWDGRSPYHISFSFHEWRSLLVAMLYYVIANYVSNGRTVGKWIAHTRIVSLAHEHVGLWQSIERVLGYGVSTAEGIGFLLYFFGRNRMCMHDRMAETIVTDTRRPRREKPRPSA